MEKHEIENTLLDSSFKEANLFWIRSNSFFIFQSLFLGFVLNYMFKIKDYFLPRSIALIIIAIGFMISITHLIIICLSKKYNIMWITELINETSSKETFEEDVYDKKLRKVITGYGIMNCPLNVFNLTIFASILLICLWIIIFTYICISF